jgi:hypothetical protein
MSRISDLYACLDEHRAFIRVLRYEHIACKSNRRMGEIYKSLVYHARNAEEIQAEIDVINEAEHKAYEARKAVNG